LVDRLHPLCQGDELERDVTCDRADTPRPIIDSDASTPIDWSSWFTVRPIPSTAAEIPSSWVVCWWKQPDHFGVPVLLATSAEPMRVEGGGGVGDFSRP